MALRVLRNTILPPIRRHRMGFGFWWIPLILDGGNRYYYFTYFVFTQTLSYIKEPYSGYALYTDSSGQYLASPDVLFTKMGYGHIEGQFSGFMYNTVTNKQKYISGNFYK